MSFRLLTVCVATALASGCGPSSHISLGSPTTTAPPTTINTTADGGQEPAILAAYRGSLADFNRVENAAPIQANSPILAQHMAGDELSSVTASLTKLAAAGQVATGAITSLHAEVNQYTGSQAVVVSCERDDTAVLDASSGKTVSAARGSTELINALVSMDAGRWRVTRHNQVSSGCR